MVHKFKTWDEAMAFIKGAGLFADGRYASIPTEPQLDTDDNGVWTYNVSITV